jgi:tellurite methyltransferase
MNDRIKWNMKYKERIKLMKEPTANSRLKDLSTYLTGGKALDLACGLGGNSLFLARMNYHVMAIDISDVVIDYIREQAEAHHLSIHPRLSDLTELNKLELQRNTFDLVVITNYLDRRLFPVVKEIIKEDGYFFMETFYQSPQKDHQVVSEQYKLKPKELLEEFKDWKILLYEENINEAKQTVFCQKL